jgi:hypothetical protein
MAAIQKSRLKAALRAVCENLYSEIKAGIEDHPELTYRQLGEKYGCSEATIARVAQRNNISRPVGPRPQTAPAVSPTGDSTEVVPSAQDTTSPGSTTTQWKPTSRLMQRRLENE